MKKNKRKKNLKKVYRKVKQWPTLKLIPNYKIQYK